jgi:hypothetical protein
VSVRKPGEVFISLISEKEVGSLKQKQDRVQDENNFVSRLKRKQQEQSNVETPRIL